jgi:3-oxoacyl-[acyl-carrier-protein] synthase III
MIETLEEQVKSINLEKNKINEDYNALKKTAVKAANKLEELNLSNAKLLYQNRVLESHSLNERQKTKLVETISKAQNITEAKVIFETSANIGQTSSKSSPQNLSEVSSKNSQLILKSNNGSNSSKQDESTSLRMKRLAGII